MAVTLKAIEATIGADGRIETVLPLPIAERTKVILTVLVEDDDDVDLAAAADSSWGKDWSSKGEDEAWAFLQEEA